MATPTITRLTREFLEGLLSEFEADMRRAGLAEGTIRHRTLGVRELIDFVSYGPRRKHKRVQSDFGLRAAERRAAERRAS